MISPPNETATACGGTPQQVTPRSAWHGWALGAVTLLLLGTGAVLFFFNPSQYGFYPLCSFHVVTGLHCPGCGALRALHRLLHGHVLEALRCNALLLLFLAALVWQWARMAVASLRGQRVAFEIRTLWLWAIVGVTLVFAVLRNVPVFEWLRP